MLSRHYKVGVIAQFHDYNIYSYYLILIYGSPWSSLNSRLIYITDQIPFTKPGYHYTPLQLSISRPVAKIFTKFRLVVTLLYMTIGHIDTVSTLEDKHWVWKSVY